MKKWEYTYFYENRDDETNEWHLYVIHEDVKKWVEHPLTDRFIVLNKLGEKGWELVSVRNDISSSPRMFSGQILVDTCTVFYFFKRELEEK